MHAAATRSSKRGSSRRSAPGADVVLAAAAAAEVDVPRKQVVLVRHAQSLGQQAPSKSRRSDQRLVDCDLSSNGVLQAQQLGALLAGKNVAPELVVCSPLTRALRTALLLFQHQDVPIIAHPGLAELNSYRPIPENFGRPWNQIKRDSSLVELGLLDRVDTSLLAQWPERSSAGSALEFLANRAELRIVIVGHCNWIQDHLQVSYVENVSPIHAHFHPGQSFQLFDGQHAWF